MALKKYGERQSFRYVGSGSRKALKVITDILNGTQKRKKGQPTLLVSNKLNRFLSALDNNQTVTF